ncbi:unnamed protein product [marine sediment metagenome]|uniref:Sulfotransferase domain-containing protein n=1 Tax=marine sediment metagenome TaxID=412755 RepID=X0RW58_9ZZZZ
MRRSGNSAVRGYIKGLYPRGVVSYLDNTNLSFHIHNATGAGKRPSSFPVIVAKYKHKNRYFLNCSEHMPILDIGVCLKKNYCYDAARASWVFNYGKDKFAEKEYNLVIVRSPHNHLASIVRYPQGRMKYLFYGQDEFLEFTELWIQYAEEALSITNHIPNKIVVLFDKLVDSPNYRECFSNTLGIKYVDSAIGFFVGTGSSFDGKKYKKGGQAYKMKVLDRWKYLIDPGGKVWWSFDECKEKLMNPKVVEYTKALFDIDLEDIFNEKR